MPGAAAVAFPTDHGGWPARQSSAADWNGSKNVSAAMVGDREGGGIADRVVCG